MGTTDRLPQIYIYSSLMIFHHIKKSETLTPEAKMTEFKKVIIGQSESNFHGLLSIDGYIPRDKEIMKHVELLPSGEWKTETPEQKEKVSSIINDSNCFQ
jgi:hypothetical protein